MQIKNTYIKSGEVLRSQKNLDKVEASYLQAYNAQQMHVSVFYVMITQQLVFLIQYSI